MLTHLLPALSKIGLHVANDKRMVLHNGLGQEAATCGPQVLAAGHVFEVLEASSYHKYLGRYLSLKPATRISMEVSHRIACAWQAYAKHRSALLDHNIPVKLRARLFEATVSPCALFGLASLTLTRADIKQIGATQRKMLRNIAGWKRLADEPWLDTMHRMKLRVSRLMQCANLSCWEHIIAARTWQLALRVATQDISRWSHQFAGWMPALLHDAHANLAHLPRGRPRALWDDDIVKFLRTADIPEPAKWSNIARARKEWWISQSDNFVQFVNGY
jgi:hypothetical protein